MISMEKFKNLVFALIKYVTLVFVAGVILIDVARDRRIEYVYKNQSLMPNVLIVALFSVAVLVCFFFGKNRMTGADWRKSYLLFAGLSVALFVLQIILAANIYMETGWDCEELTTMARTVALNGGNVGDNAYFAHHSNNVFLVAILSLSLKIASIFGLTGAFWSYFPMVLLSSLLVNLSGFFMWDYVSRVTGSVKKAYIAWAVYAFWIGLSPWICIPYSDTYSILFPIATLWFYERFIAGEDKPLKLAAFWGIEMLLAALGYFVKPTVLLMFICIAIVDFVTRFSFKRLGFSLVGIVAGFLLASGINAGARAAVGYNPDPEMDFGIPHFFYMGTNYELCGTYDQRDINFSASYTDKASRNKADMDAAMERLKAMGPRKFLVHLERKALVNFNDGTFSWGNEGAFYKGLRESDSTFTGIIRNYFYDPEVTSYKSNVFTYKWFHTLSQGMWMVLLCLILTNSFRQNKKDNPTLYIAELSILAIFMFVMVFEARARYLYLYSPVIVAFAVAGLKPLLKGSEIREGSETD